MYKVFYNDRIVYITDKPIKNIPGQYLVPDKNDFSGIISDFENNEEKGNILLIHSNPEYFLKVLKNRYTFIEAAGGIVKNKNGEILAIRRLGKWDFPKGKIEENETPEQAAIREVEEECGITGIVIKKKLPETYHYYKTGNTGYLKKTFWFEMFFEGNQVLKPQKEEMIESAHWLSKNNLQEFISGTYASLKDLVEKTITL